MAIATVALLTSPSPRSGAAASASRVSPRVYSPFGTRRLPRPMAVRADQSAGVPAGGRPRWSLFRGKDASTRERSA